MTCCRSRRSISWCVRRFPAGIGVTGFERHKEIFDATYSWACTSIETLEAEGHPALAALLGSSA
jgi:hypothetical protein